MSRPIDKEFEDADDTGVLDISGRNLRQFPVIPGELMDFHYIFEADLSNNRFDKVPKEVIGFKALVKLNCHHNSIRWLPEELNLLLNLKEIDMSRNFLPKIPSELCHMNLFSINLSNNRLLAIPNEIGKLKKLQFLDLSCNKLTDLPESIFSLANLRHLNLHRNELRYLPDDMSQLPSLQHLDVSSNLLTRLPTSLRHLEALQEFIADDNPMELPPTQVCIRGLVHICKYLEVLDKKGSDHYLSISSQRDESLRRRNERTHNRAGYGSSRPLSESTPVRNGGDRDMGLMDEMANLVNKTFGDGERTPTGGVHWSVAQYMAADNSSNQSKEEYRQAAHRLYMQQEGHGDKTPDACPASPAGSSSSLNESSTTPTHSSLPKLRSDENVYRSSTGDSSSSRQTSFVGRSLSNEKFPRSGSWNSHMRKASPVLPSKYVASDRSEEKRKTSSSSLSSKSDSQLGNVDSPPAKKPTSPGKKSPRNKRPPPLDTTKPQNGEKGADSDREGSLTPTNESPPVLEEPTTPKDDDDETFTLNSEANGEGVAVKKSVSLNSQVEIIPPSTRKPSKPLPLPPSNRNSTSSNPPDSPKIEIRELDNSPTSSVRRLPSLSEVGVDSTDKTATPSPPNDAKWQRLASPRRKKEKDVFKFLKETDPNYTIRRQQMQINIMLEKNQHVKKTVENLVGVQLSDDLGEWIMDGVILCKIINLLHPGTIATIHTPPSGQTLSRIKRTINIAAFIDACKGLNVPEEELCSAGDIVELKDPVRVITCLQRVLETKPGNLI